MIRVILLAGTHAEAQALVDKLHSETQFEMVDLRWYSSHQVPLRLPVADVLLATGVRTGNLPIDGPPLVLVSDEPDGDLPFRNGVRARLPLDVTAAELSTALTAVSHQLIVLTEAQASRLFRPDSPLDDEEKSFAFEALTSRELQVLRMLADGLGNKQIATRLNISEHTAKFHVAQILAKLRAAGRTEAVTIGIRRGLVPI